MQAQTTKGAAARGRRPLAWAAGASILLCALGGAAIYLIHDTMPARHGPTPADSVAPASGARVTPTQSPTPSADARQPVMPQRADSAAGPVDADSAASVRRATPVDGTGSGDPVPVGAGTRSSPDAHAAQASQDRPMAASGAPVPSTGTAAVGRAPTGTATTGTATTGTAPTGSMPAAAGTQREPERGAGARTESVGAPATRSDGRPRTPATGLPVSPAPGASSASGPPPAREPAAREPVPRLAAQQQAQCADTEFLSRFVCDERVRLRFCRDRWNEHPDCMVDPPRTGF